MDDKINDAATKPSVVPSHRPTLHPADSWVAMILGAEGGSLAAPRAPRIDLSTGKMDPPPPSIRRAVLHTGSMIVSRLGASEDQDLGGLEDDLRATIAAVRLARETLRRGTTPGSRAPARRRSTPAITPDLVNRKAAELCRTSTTRPRIGAIGALRSRSSGNVPAQYPSKP